MSYASWIAAPPSRQGAMPQMIHSDLHQPKSMVSVHVALLEVTHDMGPTAFCPGTHIAGGGHGSTAEPAGPAGPLELQFAIRTASLKAEVQPCKMIVPPRNRRGTVTIYDSALLHRGEVNRARQTRLILNLNVAASPAAIAEENYAGYFVGKESEAAVRRHLAQTRAAFGADFYGELLGASGAARETIVARRLAQS